jgi:ubiquinone/menaquinone biosynthesis C-methylase UbiE
MAQPTRLVTTWMREDWNERARQNARHFAATLTETWTDEDFFESGRAWIHEHVIPDLPLISGGRPPSELSMLELGCGAGRMTRGFSELFGLVDAVDISCEMIGRARSALSDRGNINYHVTDGATLSEFPAHSHDFIFSAIVFQHIPSKAIVQSYIREASRILKRGCVFKFQAEGAPIRRWRMNTWNGAGFAEEEMRRIAEESGFEVRDIRGAGTQYFWLTFVKQ